MRIGYLHYLNGTAGATLHVRELLRACRALGHDVSTVVRGRICPEDVVIDQRKVKPPRWLARYGHGLRNLSQNLSAVGEWKALRTIQPDCVVLRYAFSRASGGWAAQRAGRPWILEINSPWEWESRYLASHYRHVPVLPGAIERWLVRRAHRVVVVSKVLYDYYRSHGVASAKLSVLPNGVDPDRFHPGVDASWVRRRYGLAERVVIGFSGVFYPWHGMEGIQYLIERVLPSIPEAVLLLVGDGLERRGLMHAAERSGMGERVIFAGHIGHEEMPAYLACMDVVVAPYPKLPSFYFSPLKLFEYLSSGRSVVAAGIGQIAELIRDGDNGLLFAPGDWEQMARQLRRFLREPALRAACTERARQTVLEQFTWRHTAEQLIGLCKGLNP